MRRTDGQPFRTDNGNCIYDCPFGAITNARLLASGLSVIPGVVDHGLFVEMASALVSPARTGVRVISAKLGPLGHDISTTLGGCRACFASSARFGSGVIGAGSGGVRAARVSAQMGARVAIAEEDSFGGTCVVRGCIPKKLLVYASSFAEEFEDARGYGWSIEGARFDWPTLIANKDKDIARISGAYRSVLDNAASPFSRIARSSRTRTPSI